MQNTPSILLQQLLPQMPLFVVWVVGLVLALVFWRRHPWVSLLTLLALLLFFLQALGGTVFYVGLIQARDLTIMQRSHILTFLGVLRAVMSAIGYALLLAAIFGWRKSAKDLSPTPGYRAEDVPETGIRKDRPR